MSSNSANYSRLDENNDMYHKLRVSNPIKYGEELVDMYEEGRTQKEIATLLSCNRQMVGRYQRVGKWPKTIKDLIETNREKISNTQILNLASRKLSESELTREVEAMIGRESTDEESKTFLTVSGFNELLCKIESIESRLPSKNQVSISEKMMETPLKPKKSLTENSLHGRVSWKDLSELITTPSSVLLVICITMLTTYLIYQGIGFFSEIDPVPTSAISSAIISEFIPFLASACFALATKNSHRKIALAMLMTSILGLGFFMHGSLSSQMTRRSGRYEQLLNSRKITLTTIEAHSSGLQNIPENHVTKKQVLLSKIEKEREYLDKINLNINTLESSGKSNHKTELNYSAWIRIAAMLLNAYLVHLLFSGFFRRNEV